MMGNDRSFEIGQCIGKILAESELPLWDVLDILENIVASAFASHKNEEEALVNLETFIDNTKQILHHLYKESTNQETKE